MYCRDLFQVSSLTKGLVIPNLTNSENGGLDIEWNHITKQTGIQKQKSLLSLWQMWKVLDYTFLLCCFTADADAQVQKRIKIAHNLQFTESSAFVSRRFWRLSKRTSVLFSRLWLNQTRVLSLQRLCKIECVPIRHNLKCMFYSISSTERHYFFQFSGFWHRVWWKAP